MFKFWWSILAGRTEKNYFNIFSKRVLVVKYESFFRLLLIISLSVGWVVKRINFELCKGLRGRRTHVAGCKNDCFLFCWLSASVFYVERTWKKGCTCLSYARLLLPFDPASFGYFGYNSAGALLKRIWYKDIRHL